MGCDFGGTDAKRLGEQDIQPDTLSEEKGVEEHSDLQSTMMSHMQGFKKIITVFLSAQYTFRKRTRSGSEAQCHVSGAFDKRN